MSVSRIEALLDSISSTKGWTNPDMAPYRLRNPLMLRDFALPGKNEVDENGYRVFDTLLAGYRAGLYDLEIKCKGGSRCGIKAHDPLDNLLRVYEISELGGQQAVVKFLKRALKDDSINRNTPVNWFVETPNAAG